jgi:hypothetical protein
MGGRPPGPTCAERYGPGWIDEGTLCGTVKLSNCVRAIPHFGVGNHAYLADHILPTAGTRGLSSTLKCKFRAIFVNLTVPKRDDKSGSYQVRECKREEGEHG